MRVAILLAAVVALGCTRVGKPAVQRPMDTGPDVPSVESPKESITEHSGKPERLSEFEPKQNPFPTPEHGTDTCQEEQTDHRAVELREYITEFMSPISRSRQYRRRYPAALSYIPVILMLIDADARKHPGAAPMDHILVGVTIAYESSWDHEVIGKLGERGYMQIHGLAAGKYDEDDLNDPVNQLDAGIRYLRRAMDLCPGDLRGALTMYGTGNRCRPYAQFVKWRWRAYQEALVKFRKEKNHDKATCARNGDRP